MIALVFVLIGVVAYRWDTNLAGLQVLMSYLLGQQIVEYTTYHPSLVEWSTGLGVIAFGLFTFSLGMKYLRVVDHRLTEEEHATMK
jgi:Ni/Fe-hydrogenase subunit HybB-like protein